MREELIKVDGELTDVKLSLEEYNELMSGFSPEELKSIRAKMNEYEIKSVCDDNDEDSLVAIINGAWGEGIF